MLIIRTQRKGVISAVCRGGGEANQSVPSTPVWSLRPNPCRETTFLFRTGHACTNEDANTLTKGQNAEKSCAKSLSHTSPHAHIQQVKSCPSSLDETHVNQTGTHSKHWLTKLVNVNILLRTICGRFQISFTCFIYINYIPSDICYNMCLCIIYLWSRSDSGNRNISTVLYSYYSFSDC